MPRHTRLEQSSLFDPPPDGQAEQPPNLADALLDGARKNGPEGRDETAPMERTLDLLAAYVAGDKR